VEDISYPVIEAEFRFLQIEVEVMLWNSSDDGSISNVTGWYECPHNLKLKAQEGK
jgi:hypothetical protein